MKHRLYPSAIIIAAVLALLLYYGLSVVTGGATTTTTTLKEAKITTTTTTIPVPEIPQPDLDNLSELYDKHNLAAQSIEDKRAELKPLLNIKSYDLSNKQFQHKAMLESGIEWAIIERNKARRSYNVLAKKYSAAQLDAFELVKKLEVVE